MPPVLITPEYCARSGTEHGEQMAVFCWASKQMQRFPVLRWMYAIPNGGGRSAAQGAMLKAEGVKGGVADICLPVPCLSGTTNEYGQHLQYAGLYIEMKKATGIVSDVKPEQLAFAAFVVGQGYMWEVCYGWVEAVTAIQSYLTHRMGPTSDKQSKVHAKLTELLNAKTSSA